MVARSPITLTFGDKPFTVRPFTIGQLEKLEDLFSRSAQPDSPRLSSTAMAKAAIGVALSRDYATEKVDDLECDIQELPLQLQAIMTLGGFVSDASSGGAPAAAQTSASTGGFSAAG